MKKKMRNNMLVAAKASSLGAIVTAGFFIIEAFLGFLLSDADILFLWAPLVYISIAATLLAYRSFAAEEPQNELIWRTDHLIAAFPPLTPGLSKAFDRDFKLLSKRLYYEKRLSKEEFDLMRFLDLFRNADGEKPRFITLERRISGEGHSSSEIYVP